MLATARAKTRTTLVNAAATSIRIPPVPRDLAQWAALFNVTDVPVLASTAAELEVLRANEDAVDAHLLAQVIVDDPLMTLKLLAHVSQLRRGREGSDIETVTAALVMLGIAPFFATFGLQPTVEDCLADDPRALRGFRNVLRRSLRAARFAVGFAVHRMDYDALVIREAALLNGFAELLLWLRAPSLALEVNERQTADATLRSVAVQRDLLHVELGQLEHHLMSQWGLPALLVEVMDDHAEPTSQVRNAQLAIRLARHSSEDWHNLALPDDIQEISELLNISPDAAHRLVLEIDADS